jgi:hypothetical protein
MGSDGYRVVANTQTFSKTVLEGYRVLVVSNALGAKALSEKEWTPAWSDAGAGPAFTDEECDAVRDWVRGGGALLLIADHPPFGGAAENLARRFGVDMSTGYAWDEVNSYKDMNNPGVIVRAGQRTLSDHATGA